MFDFIQADNLECPDCHAIADHVLLQSVIAVHPNGTTYHVGDCVPLPTDVPGFAAGGYIAVRPEAEVGRRLNILETWWCRACGRHNNVCAWIFQDQVLVATQPVLLSGAAVVDSDFVTEELPEEALKLELQRSYPGHTSDIRDFSIRDIVHTLATGEFDDDDDH